MKVPDRIRRHIDSRYDPTAGYSVEREVLEFFLDLIENDDSEEEIERLRDEIEELKFEVEDAKDEAASAQDELDMLQYDMEKAESQIEKLEAENESLRTQLAAYGLQNHPG